ncbi:MAG: alpha/beta hydrolase fold domain-containing protein [Pirellulaceae bacterium]|nr:alpha/beta hydrolase fold domain-containing protein [Pirellulaceae bacterium]
MSERRRHLPQLALTAAVVAASFAAAQSPPAAAQAGEEERFKQFDKNGDGKLTREEFPAAKIFDGADADKDGLLTPEEIAAYFRKQQTGAPTTPPKPAPQPVPGPEPAPAAKVDIVETLDVRYATIVGVDPKFLSLDLHAPRGAKAAPVVIFVHGGYWKAGDKANKGHLPQFFCGRGVVFVTINYRLAPAAKHPALIQDVARAVAWVHDHIAEHGGDPSQIFLTGHSAGAHLVALLGTDAKRLGEQGKPLAILRGVIPLDSAAMDIRDVADKDRRPDSPYRAAFGENPAAWADASPIVHAASAKSLPPFQIVVAYGPAIANKKAGMDEFAATLRQNGTRAEVLDASSFREHQSLMTEFGEPDDPVSKAVLEFIESVRAGTPVAGLGSERVLTAEGTSAAESARTLQRYRTRILMKQFDKNGDGRITRDEMQAQPFLFDRLDVNQDGVVTADELRAFDLREEPSAKPAPAPPAKPSADTWRPRDDAIGSASVSYRDPELLQQGGLMVFVDAKVDVWVSEMDLQTGCFKTSRDGRQHRVDGPISKWSRYCNGPEWGLDAKGPAIVYIKDNAQHTVRRLDDGSATRTTARHLDPETLVSERELFVYYTCLANGVSELRLCRTGVSAGQTTTGNDAGPSRRSTHYSPWSFQRSSPQCVVWIYRGHFATRFEKESRT